MMSLAEKAWAEESRSQAQARGSRAEQGAGAALHAPPAGTPGEEDKSLQPPRPRKKKKIPLMTSQEAAALTVPFAKVTTRLRDHTQETCSGGGRAPARPASDSCEGMTREGVRCKNTAQSSHKAAPVIMWGDRCTTHQEAKADRAVEERFELSDWSADAIELLGTKEHLHGRGLPQGSFAWTCRLFPSVRACVSAPKRSLLVRGSVRVCLQNVDNFVQVDLLFSCDLVVTVLYPILVFCGIKPFRIEKEFFSGE